MIASDLKSDTRDDPRSRMPPTSRMHDASRFPLVRLRRRAVKPGYAFAWRAEMQRLLALDDAVRASCREHGADETPDDTRLRAAWLRSQSATLARVLPWLHRDRAAHRSARHDARSVARSTTQGSGVRTVVVSSMRVAGELAPVLLKHSPPRPRTDPLR